MHKRINELISTYSKGNQTAFANKIGVSQATLHRNLKAQDDKKLMDITGRVLLAIPEVRREWLLKGEGNMFLGVEDAQTPPTPHIDTALLQQVIEMLEEHLKAVKSSLSPANKAVVISQLYELVIEREAENRQPIQMMRLVMGALAKVANG